jgi:hypothetical protein
MECTSPPPGRLPAADGPSFSAALLAPAHPTGWILLDAGDPASETLARRLFRAGLGTVRAALTAGPGGPDTALRSVGRLVHVAAGLRTRPAFDGQPIVFLSGFTAARQVVLQR